MLDMIDDQQYSRMEELVTKDRNHRRRTLLILGLVTVIVLVVVVAVLMITASSNTNARSSKLGSEAPAISLEDYFEGRLAPHSFNATWVSGNELLYRDASENIVLHNTKTQVTKILLPADKVPSGPSEHELSPDQKYLLIAHNYRKLYSRYSFIAEYTIVDIATQKLTQLRTANDEKIFRLALWGPQENALVYIFNNNIYYRPYAVIEADIPLTGDGENERIYNGIPDWVYEEEVLSSNKGLWFSPKGKKLAYITLNDTNVGIMHIPVYGPAENLDYQYTKTIPLRYPKAGTPNPEVGLRTVDLESASTFRMELTTRPILPPAILGRDPVLSAVTWADENTVCAIWLNRIQNKAVIVSCDSITSECQTILNITEEGGWLELFTPPIFSKDGSKMLLILSQDQGSNYGAFKHATLIEHKPNSKPIPLSHGKFVVTEILTWDEAKQLVYFLGTSEHDAAVQHLYSVSSNLQDKHRKMNCLTCKVKSASDNKDCTYNTALFSHDASFYTLNCAGPGVPEISVYDSNHRRIEIWERNEEILELVEEKLTPVIKKMKVDITDGFVAQVHLQLPPNMDMSGDVKYPMLINVYGGPNSNEVIDKFGLSWFSYLAANKSIIVASIDGRGSGLKGDKILFAGYGHLGTVEIFDQINVTRYLQQKLPYVDEKRTAIWGWSYGGYASGLALAEDPNVFKCGISIAPVTDWALYDSIYTERFMGLPSERGKAYREAALLNKVEKLRNKQYLLIHGTLDDNVHYQQSMLLAKALEINDIQFRQQSYPDEDHGLTSVRRHLYHTFENFLDDCFQPNLES